jgi:hypothetical protein
MQSYSAIFDVNVDGQSKATRETRNIPNLSFELHGEGHLPRVTVLRPAIKNKKAQTMMIFNKLLLGRQATQQLLLVNDGVLPAKVNFRDIFSVILSLYIYIFRLIFIYMMLKVFIHYKHQLKMFIQKILLSMTQHEKLQLHQLYLKLVKKLHLIFYLNQNQHKDHNDMTLFFDLLLLITNTKIQPFN